MKILILQASPRANGNTAWMAEEYKKAAEAAGHEVTLVNVSRKKIAGCLACEYCHGKGNGRCIQDDDMQAIYPRLEEAEMVLLASPVYSWSFSGQMQSCITRFYAPGAPAARKYALLLSSGSPGVYDAVISQYKAILGFIGARDLGIKVFNGENQKTEANLAEMRAFGASL
jgi:multimeric flavodoxin WrbA